MTDSVTTRTGFFRGYTADPTLGADLEEAVQEALAATATATSALTTGTASINSTVASGIASINSRTAMILSYPVTGAAGDGVTDDSTAINTAQTAAVALGIPRLLFPTGKTYYAPSLNWTDTVFIGDDCKLITGTPQRKFIIPTDAAEAAPLPPGVLGARHLNRMQGTATPTVVFVGDSMCSDTQQGLFTAPGLVQVLEDKLKRENPEKTFSFLNYGIGGSTFQQLAGYENGTINTTPVTFNPGTYPTWWSNHAISWIATVGAAAPDVIFMIFTSNDSVCPDADTVAGLVSVMASINGWAKVPDVVFCTSFARSYRSTYTPTTMDAEDRAAGIIRTYAQMHGYGLLDFNRRGAQVRDGFDPWDTQVFLDHTKFNGQAQTFPYQVSASTYDYGFSMLDFGTPGAAAWTNVTEMWFPLSSASGNRVGLGVTGGFWYYYVSTNFGRDSVAPVTTSVPAVIVTATGGYNGQAAVFFSVRGNTVRLAVTNAIGDIATLYEGPVERFGGRFDATVQIHTGSRTSAYIQYPTYSRPSLNMPRLSDYEMWGPQRYGGGAPTVTGDDYGGDSFVHPTQLATRHVYEAVLNVSSFAAPQPNLQSVTVVSNVNGSTQRPLNLQNYGTGDAAISVGLGVAGLGLSATWTQYGGGHSTKPGVLEFTNLYPTADLTLNANGLGTIYTSSQTRRLLATGLTAAGSNQAGALLLAADLNVVATAAASTGVRLPVGKPGMEVCVINRGANTLSIYPATGAQIDALGANVATTTATNTKVWLICASSTQWYLA